jgi:hypothetical protein
VFPTNGAEGDVLLGLINVSSALQVSAAHWQGVVSVLPPDGFGKTVILPQGAQAWPTLLRGLDRAYQPMLWSTLGQQPVRRDYFAYHFGMPTTRNNF